jgi:hypothetical protein
MEKDRNIYYNKKNNNNFTFLNGNKDTVKFY